MNSIIIPRCLKGTDMDALTKVTNNENIKTKEA